MKIHANLVILTIIMMCCLFIGEGLHLSRVTGDSSFVWLCGGFVAFLIFIQLGYAQHSTRK